MEHQNIVNSLAKTNIQPSKSKKKKKKKKIRMS